MSESGVDRKQAADDVVPTFAQSAGNARPPLIVLQPLLAFLDSHHLGEGPIEAEPIGAGHSNVTYAIKRGELELVLRRPPRPPLPPSAHDVLREARLLRCLADTAARVPKVLASCEDPQVIGAPFYLMEKISGEVIVAEMPSALDTWAGRRHTAEELVDALAEIHSVDWSQANLHGFGRPTGYLERQLRRFSGLWDVNKTREVPAVQRVRDWLADHMPSSEQRASIVHGDYRLGNTMFATTAPAQLIAVLDWEMATIGDPLADLGYLCMMWTQADDPRDGIRDRLGGVTRAEGFLTRAELIERYEQRTGAVMRDLSWYTTLALWKATVFMEGNYKRALAGMTDDPYVKQFGDGVLELAAEAERVALDG